MEDHLPRSTLSPYWQNTRIQQSFTNMDDLHSPSTADFCWVDFAVDVWWFIGALELTGVGNSCDSRLPVELPSEFTKEEKETRKW